MYSCETKESSADVYKISADISGLEAGWAELAIIDLESNETVILDSA